MMITKRLLLKVPRPILFIKTTVALLFICSAAFSQVKIGTNPTTIEPNSNLEVEASTAGRKMKVDKTTGQVTIADGTQGVDKVLTSDANGNARWEQPTGLVVLRAYNPNQLQPTIGAVSFRPPIPFVSGNSTGYDETTGTYTIQETGFYTFSYLMEVQGPLGQIFTLAGALPLPIEDQQMRGSSTTWNGRTLTATGHFMAGTGLNVFLVRGGEIPFDSNWKVRRISLTVIKY